MRKPEEYILDLRDEETEEYIFDLYLSRQSLQLLLIYDL